jgi:hypothetical protein
VLPSIGLGRVTEAMPRIFRAEVLLILMATGCSGIAEQASPQTQSRYQLQTDRNGNVFRLDTSTGEVTKMTAESDGRRKPPRTNRAQVDVPTTTATAQAASVTATAESAGQAIASPFITNACSRTAGTPSSLTVSAATADVFIDAVRAQAPMTRLANGTLLTTMGSQNEWFFVRFADSQWGQRAGFVHCSDVRETPDSSNGVVDSDTSGPHVSDEPHETLP